MSLYFPAILLIALAVASQALHTRHSTSYDYVIVGGGTAGSVLAGRLSEDPSVTVALIEAGGSVFNNSLVETIIGNCLPCGTPVDWNYTTVPQQYANNTIGLYHAGKALGGSSAINGMVYLRPSSAEIDSWAALGNTNWSWEILEPYYKKSEHLQIPTESQAEEGATYVADANGFTGPVDIGWWYGLNTSNAFAKALNTSWSTKGLKWNQDPNTGNPQGLFLHPSEIDVAADIRADAARSYYWPVANRSNLHAYTFTTAQKVLFGNGPSHYSKNGSVVVTGVKVILPSGQNATISANREVILSAGTYRTPALLEASGIGNPSVLHNLSIPVLVDLPGVGAHMQDQFDSSIFFNSSVPVDILQSLFETPLYAYVTVKDLFPEAAEYATVAAELRGNISSYAKTVSATSDGATSIEAATAILNIRADLILEQNAPVAELLFTSEFAAFWGTLALSTGNAHTGPNTSHPLLNPSVMQLPWDILIQSQTARLIRTLYTTTSPLSTLTISELSPGLSAVPTNASQSVWKAFFESSWTPNYHAVGTSAMMKREWGGVVDPLLKVYGTVGLRVVDAGVIPANVNGHPTSTVYAVAERAAEFVKGAWA